MLVFAEKGTICAIPADSQSTETVHFVEIVGHEINTTPNITLKDDWGQPISPGQRHIEGSYTTTCNIREKRTVYARDDRRVFFFKECIVYPFVQHTVVQGGIVVSNIELCEIIDFVQSTGMRAL